METDIATLSARERLELLRGELAQRGLAPEIRGTREKLHLYVVNPAEPGLTGTVDVWNGHYRWTWGPNLGPFSDVRGVAERIAHVLRGLAP